MLSLKEQVLALVRAKGPVLPIQITKETGRDLLFAGAILSELVQNKLIKISNAKIGSSPVYYVQGQEIKLHMLYNGLPMREKEAYNLLKEKKVLKDTEANPGIRVALRMIKDFAIAHTIGKEGKQELVWKWHLLPDQEVQTYLKSPGKRTPSTIEQPQVGEIKSKLPEQRVLSKEEKAITKKPRVAQQKIEFLQDIVQYIKQSNIIIREEIMVRKNREFDLIVSIPTNIGNIEYLINAKNKKTLNEADLTLAYQKGQNKKLPVILLTNGELTKKAKIYREKNLKGYVLVKKI